MNKQNPQKGTKSKAYSLQDAPVYVVKEPEVLYKTKSETELFEDDFNRALATAITMEEFRQHMYKRIDAWPWKEK
ncbi:hypothetical protein FACS189421_04560 [Bacteroidia bacterium]|nr:hypothetical protein FACS189421_04560 [Bacteroidia bacterium]GHT49257.1 hypothetical protein FACS189440_14640 [Bacteroidia bacterium]